MEWIVLGSHRYLPLQLVYTVGVRGRGFVMRIYTAYLLVPYVLHRQVSWTS